MNTISSIAGRFVAKPAVSDASLKAISLVSLAGLALSLGLIALGFDLNGIWV
jgi:hypothetical protein